MKKALSLGLTLALLAGGLFADAPVAESSVAEFKGDAKVTWGVNLNNLKSGFFNETSASLKLNLINKGDTATTGSGIWGEIKVKTDGLSVENAYLKNGTASVDFAKLHFGDMFAIGITKGNTNVGEYKLITAVDYKNKSVGNVGSEAKHGITLALTTSALDANVDFRSAATEESYVWKKVADSAAVVADARYMRVDLKDNYKAEEKDADTSKANVADLFGKGTGEETVVYYKRDGAGADKYTNAYALKADVTLKVVENLKVKAGASYDINVGKYRRFAAAMGVDYKLSLNDTMYVKPQLGYTFYVDQDAAKSADNNLATGVFFGWGKEEQDTNIYYTPKKVADGVSVATVIGLNTFKTFDVIPLYVGAWDSATFVKGLTWGVSMTTTDIAKFVDTTKVTAEAKYAIPVATGSIAPKAGISMDNFKTLSTAMKAGVELTGFVPNTTFAVEYGELKFTKDGVTDGNKGNLDFSVKIAL